MPAITEAIDIDATPETIFPWLIEPDRLARWIGGFVGSEALTDGGARLGARSRDTLSEGSRTIVVETEITEFQPGRLMRVHIEAGSFRSDDSYRLIPADQGTRLVYTSDVHLGGLMRLMAPIVTRQLRARAERDLATLKRVIETGN
jgi:carbon monoxide dehydrogenase subunit G